MAKNISILCLLLLSSLSGWAPAMRTEGHESTHNDEEELLVSNASARQASSSAPLSFYAELAKLKVWGYQSMFCGTNSQCATIDNYPSGNSHVEMRHAEVEKELQKVPARQRSGEIVRGNDLGFFIMNQYLWSNDGEYKTIGLGVSVEDHEYIRPIFDKILSPNGGIWTAEQIATQVKEFIDGKQVINTEGDIGLFATKLMHKIHLGIDMSDQKAKDFSVFQGAVLPKIIMPDMLGPGSAQQDERAEWLNWYMDYMEKDTRNVFPADMKGRNPGDKMYKVAAGLMDSMLFAGGLSVDSLTKSALNVMYAQDLSPHAMRDDDSVKNDPVTEDEKAKPMIIGGKLTLRKENVEAFVYEVARLFPGVVGFPWWQPRDAGGAYDGNKGGSHYTRRTVMNLAMSLRDPRVWGKDYGVFKVRDLDKYKQKMGNAWAMPANENKEDGSLGPMSRGCPGKDLSMVIVTTIVSELVNQFDNWVVTEGTEGGIKFQDCTPFLKSNFAKLARVLKKGYLTMYEHGEEANGKTRYYYLEDGNDAVPHTLRSYAKPEDRVPDDAKKNSLTWDLSEVDGMDWRSRYHVEQEQGKPKCFRLKAKVPWGPFSGRSWESSKIFCAESEGEQQAWFEALKGAPF